VARVDYTDTASAYRRARTLPPAALAAWTGALGSLQPAGPVGRVLDVGAGPGGFVEPLREWFGAPVVAVEPSAGMRREASTTVAVGRDVPYVAAVAEHLPVRDACADIAWLSTVVHQFDDLDAAASELHRVVRRDGLVLIRGFFGDQQLSGLFGHFPGIDRAAATFPVTDEVVQTFGRAGLSTERQIDVVEPWTFELDSWLDRVHAIRHTDSALRPLTDEEFDEGVRRVAAVHGDRVGPIDTELVIRLLVLRS
jgi:ubiquinone/menaquinone biosynthesis C-methylase UbiE